MVLSGRQFRGFDQHMLYMFVAQFGKRCPQDLVCGTLLFSAKPTIADGLLNRPEARYVPDLQCPSERGDGSHSGNGSESLDPFSQQRIPLERTHQSVFRFPAPVDRLPAQP
jgi:hypothetical protein